MEEKEPPWRAELLKALESAVEHWYHSTDEDLLDVLQPHILAAEQRGRDESAALLAAQQEVIDRLAREGLEAELRGRREALAEATTTPGGDPCQCATCHALRGLLGPESP